MMPPTPTEGTEPPSPAPPRNRVPIAVIAAVVVALLLLGGAGGTLLYLRWAKAPVAAGGRPVRVTVAPGASADAVARDLEARHLIRSARVFVTAAKGIVIRPGIYDISPSESPAHMAARLERGDVVTVRVTFPEGFTLRQIARRLARNKLCDEAAFYELVTTRGDTLKASFTPPKNLEGYLFPDTYRFPLGASEISIAERMLAGFDTVFVRRHAEGISRSGRTLPELVTVASMVEREAEVDKDRPLIAGVIYNRLRRGMRLQIDATVQYALAEHKTRLLYRDLKVDSPYNTYRVAGLPPGAICCPGLPSLISAVDPARHDYLFYVAQADRSHVFARTGTEHERNIAAVRREKGR